MDCLTEFWERRAKEAQRVKIAAPVSGMACIAIAIAIDSSSIAIILAAFGMISFGVRLVYDLWHVDELGGSRIRAASPVLRLLFSLFYILWFAFLGLIFAIVSADLFRT